MKKTFNYVWRSLKLVWHYNARFYWLSLLNHLTAGSIPYISIWYLSQLVTALGEQNLEAIGPLIIQYVLIYCVLQAIGMIIAPILQTELWNTSERIRSLTQEKVMRMNFHDAESQHVQNLLTSIQMRQFNSNATVYSISQNLPEYMKQVIEIVWSVVLIYPLLKTFNVIIPGYEWLSSPWLVLVIILIMVLALVLPVLSNRRLGKFFEDFEKVAKDLNIKYNYEIGMIWSDDVGQEIRLYELQSALEESKVSQDSHVMTLVNQLVNLHRNSYMIVEACSGVVLFIAYILMGVRVLAGVLPIGMVVQLSSAFTTFIRAMADFTQSIVGVFGQSEGYSEFFELLDMPDDSERGTIPVEKRLDHDYEMEVKNLSFAYPETDEYVLKNITASFEPGRKYAIVGENGSGKTTFIKLLLRLYEPNEGEVRLNQIDAQKYNMREYFNLFSVVFQDFKLANLPIEENIAASREVDHERVEHVLKQVDLADFVDGLPQKSATYLGTSYSKDGVEVSGGQSQRIAMARALYKDARFMILDEPTAALDPITEFEIYQKFDEIVEDRTAFYISHRLSSCRFCDEILVFDQGEIIQRGHHDELVKQPGKYQELWNAQAQYYTN